MNELKNQMEVIVASIADRVIPESGMCRCEKCRLDVIAHALNQLPPHYVVSGKGALLASADVLAMQKSTDVFSAVLHSVRLVEASPRHGTPAE